MQNGSSPGPRRRIIWTIAALVVVAFLTLGAFNAAALPGCESCHDRNGFRAATAASAHATVDCRSCHIPAGSLDRIAFSLRQPLHMFVPLVGGNERDAASVPDSRCLVCHADVRETIATSGGLRIAHASCATAASCTDCHSATAHGEATAWLRAFDMDACLSCHVGAALTACDLCHEGRLPAARIRSGTFAVTHGANWQATHGMGDAATCTVCHNGDDCADCHGPGLPHEADFLEVHGEFALGGEAKCGGCHAQAFCSTCHGIEMPHPPQFTPTHAEVAVASLATCERCHAESDCAVCHEKHVHPGGAVGGSSPTGGGGS